jgi:hypothetical protein
MQVLKNALADCHCGILLVNHDITFVTGWLSPAGM